MVENVLNITPEEATKLSIKELEKLDSQLDVMADAIEVDWDHQRPFEEYQEAFKDINNAAGIISREVNMKAKPKMEKLDNIGDLFTFEDFKSNCESGGFIDYDGYGYYATSKKQSNIAIRPSHIMKNKYRSDFTHVMWYNR
jgi:hypothetical protein